MKGILFFSFWQSIFISILVASGAITSLGPYTDREHISLGLIDTLICIEMPFFALAHLFAFSTSDFIDRHAIYVGRMPVWYAFKDAFGGRDVVEDVKAVMRGEGMDYREFEPTEGYMHQGLGRERRIRAGLRYSQGGKKKYWLPQHANTQHTGHGGGAIGQRIGDAVGRVTGHGPTRDEDEEVYAPLLDDQAASVVHIAPDLQAPSAQTDEGFGLFGSISAEGEGFDLPFGDPDQGDDELFAASRSFLFGDYLYPCVDASSEEARRAMWAEEERVLRDERGAAWAPISTAGKLAVQREAKGYGAVGTSERNGRGRVDNFAESPKGKTRVVKPGEERLVDKADNQILAPPSPSTSRSRNADAQDVRLTWTASRTHTPTQTPRIQTPTPPVSASPLQHGITSYSSSPRTFSSSARASPSTSTLKPPPSPLRTPSPGSRATALPPDAVDLVVEDTQERRRVNPGVQGGGPVQPRVYRRGYVIESDDDDDEVESESVPAVAVPTFAVDGEEDGEDERVNVVMSATPPLHAHIDRVALNHSDADSADVNADIHHTGNVYGYGGRGLSDRSRDLDEDNPWA